MSLAARLTQPFDYVGYSLAARLIGTFLPYHGTMLSRLGANSVFEYPYADLYWSRLAYRAGNYSQSEETLLKGVRDVPYCFIDCGANYGFFSTLVSSQEYGFKPAIAIEADPDTFQWLRMNCANNDGRFHTYNRAVYSKSGMRVNIDASAKHEARSISLDGKCLGRQATTLTLDELIPMIDAIGQDYTVLKLDVEGVEIEALRGGERLLKRNCLVLYEDHGNDPTHKVSRHLMGELGMSLFVKEPGQLRRLENMDEIAKLKMNRRVGYDLIATRSPAWLERLERL